MWPGNSVEFARHLNLVPRKKLSQYKFSTHPAPPPPVNKRAIVRGDITSEGGQLLIARCPHYAFKPLGTTWEPAYERYCTGEVVDDGRERRKRKAPDFFQSEVPNAKKLKCSETDDLLSTLSPGSRLLDIFIPIRRIQHGTYSRFLKGKNCKILSPKLLYRRRLLNRIPHMLDFEVVLNRVTSVTGIANDDPSSKNRPLGTEPSDTDIVDSPQVTIKRSALLDAAAEQVAERGWHDVLPSFLFECHEGSSPLKATQTHVTASSTAPVSAGAEEDPVTVRIPSPPLSEMSSGSDRQPPPTTWLSVAGGRGFRKNAVVAAAPVADGVQVVTSAADGAGAPVIESPPPSPSAAPAPTHPSPELTRARPITRSSPRTAQSLPKTIHAFRATRSTSMRKPLSLRKLSPAFHGTRSASTSRRTASTSSAPASSRSPRKARKERADSPGRLSTGSGSTHGAFNDVSATIYQDEDVFFCRLNT